MDAKEVRRLFGEGKNPRQIAQVLGCSRKEVEKLVSEFKSRRRRRVLILASIFFGIVILSGTAFLVHRPLFREPTDLAVYKKILEDADGLNSAPPGDSWFIEREKNPTSLADLESELHLIQGMTARLNKTLMDNSAIPEVAAEKDMFGGHLMPTIFSMLQGGITRSIGRDLSDFKNPRNLEIVFYSRDAFRHRRIQSRLLFYDAQWRALIIAALKFTDDIWFDALLAHEIWHALKHRQGAASATAPPLSDSWIGEEIEAHEIESKILNLRTGGVYRERLNTIVSRISARNIKEFLLQVTPEDLRHIDQLFKPGLSQEKDMRAAQYFLDLGSIWLLRQYTGHELFQKKIALYNYLITPVTRQILKGTKKQ